MIRNGFLFTPASRKRETMALGNAKGHGASLSVATLQGAEAEPGLLVVGGQRSRKAQ